MKSKRILSVVMLLMIPIGFIVLYALFPRDWNAILESNDFFFADVSEYTEGIQEFGIPRNLWRHIMFSPLMYPLYRLFSLLPENYPLILPGVLYAGANIGLFAWIRLKSSERKAATLFLTVLFGFCNVQIIYSGVPESYIPTGTLVLICIVSWIQWSGSRQAYLLAAFMISLIVLGLLNPLTFIFFVISYIVTDWLYLGSRKGFVPAVGISVLTILLMMGFRVYIMNALGLHVGMSKSIQGAFRYLGSYGDIENFINRDRILTVAINTFITPVIGIPTHSFHDIEVLSAYGNFKGIVNGYLSSIPALLALASFMYLSLMSILRGGYFGRFGILLIIFIILHTLFLIWFNPRESILYSPQILGPVLLIFGDGIEGIESHKKWPLLIILVVLTGLTNLVLLSRIV